MGRTKVPDHDGHAAPPSSNFPDAAQAVMIAAVDDRATGVGHAQATVEGPRDVPQHHEMHAAIRERLVAAYGDAGASVRILYGGSVKPDNATEILGTADVGGALVGGASLTAAQFLPIVEAGARLD